MIDSYGQFHFDLSHEAPNDPEDPLTNQNIKDRFYGCNDPVADKLVKRYQETTKEEKIKSGNTLQTTEDDYDPKFSKTTPGLPPVLPMPSTEFKNDFFNLSAAPIMPSLYGQAKKQKTGQSSSSATISKGPSSGAPRSSKN